jgi:hypothetical protein
MPVRNRAGARFRNLDRRFPRVDHHEIISQTVHFGEAAHRRACRGE